MDLVMELFNTTDLYQVLGLKKEAAEDAKAAKKAYLKAALKYHPDKASDKDRDEMTRKFQVISQIYNIFQDPELKKVYDQTGEWPTNEEFSLDVDTSAKLNYLLVEKFKTEYIGSEEEKEDVLRYYKEKGDITYVIENIFFGNILDDMERVQGIIDALVAEGKVEKSKKKVNQKTLDRKITKAKKEAEEAEQMKKEMGFDGDSMDSLRKAMQLNSAKRSSFLDDLAAKYGGADAEGPPKKTARQGRKKGSR